MAACDFEDVYEDWSAATVGAEEAVSGLWGAGGCLSGLY